MGKLVRALMGMTILLVNVTVNLALGLAFLLPRISDVNLAVVYSGSMEPAMPVGALALMEPVDPSEIKVGDIIAFNPVRDPNTIVSHRVVEVIGKGAALEFRTKGDANEDPDVVSVPAANVLARVSYNLPYIGYGFVRFGHYARSRLGFVLLICLPALLLISLAARDASLMLSPRKRRVMKLRARKTRRNKRRFHMNPLLRALTYI